MPLCHNLFPWDCPHMQILPCILHSPPQALNSLQLHAFYLLPITTQCQCDLSFPTLCAIYSSSVGFPTYCLQWRDSHVPPTSPSVPLFYLLRFGLLFGAGLWRTTTYHLSVVAFHVKTSQFQYAIPTPLALLMGGRTDCRAGQTNTTSPPHLPVTSRHTGTRMPRGCLRYQLPFPSSGTGGKHYHMRTSPTRF